MGQKRDELMERARILPELRARAEEHLIALKAQGARIYDIDNLGYIDFTGGRGAAIVGYANQFVLDAVRKVLVTGVPDGLHVPQEVELAETMQRYLPWASGWWFCRNADEALRLLLEWIRRSTDKRHFLMLDGGGYLTAGACFDGTAPKTSPLREVRGWDLEQIEATLTAGASKVAAMVVDPLMSRFGVIPPPPGVLERIADACRRANVILVLDERVSGFRVHRGGASGLADVAPDFAVYGGALGGGFPIGAVAFGESVETDGFENGQPMPAPHAVSLAAAEAVLSILKNDTVYERLEERTEQLASGVVALGERFARPMTVNRMGSAFAIYMTRKPVVDGASAAAADQAAYRRLVTALLDEGVLLPQEPGGIAFVSNAHGGKDIDETLAAFERVLLKLHQEDLP
jgi:glutamate-1-semialdehyde 2,1-aminomutase